MKFSNTTLYNINKIIDYLYKDEHKHYLECDEDDQENHIFKSIKYLQNEIRGEKNENK